MYDRLILKIMSYFNTNFSSLEDAWGENFSKKPKEKNVAKTKDPICNLYNQRNRSTSMPFTENKHKEQEVIYPTESYDKYYGYKDAYKYSRKPSRISNYKSSLPSKNSVSSPDPYDSQEEHVTPFNHFQNKSATSKKRKPSVRRSSLTKKDHSKINRDIKRAEQMQRSRTQVLHHSYDDSDSDFDYSHHSDDDVQSIIEEEIEHYHTVRNTPLYSEYDSDSDVESELDNDDMCANTNDEPLAKTSSYPKKNKFELEKEYESILKDNTFTNLSVHKRSPKLHKNNYMDILLFTITGILLIFIMEQFVQIGIKLKK